MKKLTAILVVILALVLTASALAEPVLIGIPDDGTNLSRAIKLLETAGLLEVDPAAGYTPEIKERKSDVGKYSKISKPEDLSSDDIVREVIRRRFASANEREASDVADIMDDEEQALLEEIISRARSGSNGE